MNSLINGLCELLELHPSKFKCQTCTTFKRFVNHCFWHTKIAFTNCKLQATYKLQITDSPEYHLHLKCEPHIGSQFPLPEGV